jgi:chorismate synthase
MGRLRYLTAGESHGEALVGIIDGIPAGLELSAERDIDPCLAERQKGYGRSYRQTIENDRAKILSGVRFERTTGAPITILIENKDWKNWKEKMSVAGSPPSDLKNVTVPRPGHADLAGAIKYGHQYDIRNVIERSSARETAMRVAIGRVAGKLLEELSVLSVTYVRSIGNIQSTIDIPADNLQEFRKRVSLSKVSCPDLEAEKKMIALIDEAKEKKDTLGGVVETIFLGMPIGVGSGMQWDRKLDGLLSQAVMSIQGVKSVEIGAGKDAAGNFGSRVHDEISVASGKIVRKSNNAGGIEGGMTNGEPIVIRTAMKPIPTLMQPLGSVDLSTMKETDAFLERSDVCAVPSLSVIVEQVAGFTLADALLDTFGGDTMIELKERIEKRRLSL